MTVLRYFIIHSHKEFYLNYDSDTSVFKLQNSGSLKAAFYLRPSEKSSLLDERHANPNSPPNTWIISPKPSNLVISILIELLSIENFCKVLKAFKLSEAFKNITSLTKNIVPLDRLTRDNDFFPPRWYFFSIVRFQEKAIYQCLCASFLALRIYCIFSH